MGKKSIKPRTGSLKGKQDWLTNLWLDSPRRKERKPK